MCTGRMKFGWVFLLLARSPTSLSGEEDENARRPERFAIIFNMGYAGDHLPRDPASFEKLVRGIRKAHFNTILCKYEIWRGRIWLKSSDNRVAFPVEEYATELVRIER